MVAAVLVVGHIYERHDVTSLPEVEQAGSDLETKAGKVSQRHWSQHCYMEIASMYHM